jgi:RNA polymerase sigma factor (sigma-70 family)
MPKFYITYLRKMSTPSDGFWGFFGLDPHEKFKNNLTHFEGLKRHEIAAIQYLEFKTDRAARWLLKQLNLPIFELEDIRQDALLIFLTKIEKDKYTFTGSAPSTYFVEIFRNVALNKSRSKYHKNTTVSIEKGAFQLEDKDFSALEMQRENAQFLTSLLKELGELCHQIIQLRHLDDYSDEEVIEKKWTKYTSADSLKVKRSECMKKLRNLASKYEVISIKNGQ